MKRTTTTTTRMKKAHRNDLVRHQLMSQLLNLAPNRALIFQAKRAVAVRYSVDKVKSNYLKRFSIQVYDNTLQYRINFDNYE